MNRQRAAARSRRTRSRATAYCSNAIRSAAVINPWVGRTQAVGHRVMPLERINSATTSQSSSDIFTPLPINSLTVRSARGCPAARLLSRPRRCRSIHISGSGVFRRAFGLSVRNSSHLLVNFSDEPSTLWRKRFPAPGGWRCRPSWNKRDDRHGGYGRRTPPSRRRTS